jgi:hypothetical protein
MQELLLTDMTFTNFRSSGAINSFDVSDKPRLILSFFDLSFNNMKQNDFSGATQARFEKFMTSVWLSIIRLLQAFFGSPAAV